jgi:hypothetical protein
MGAPPSHVGAQGIEGPALYINWLQPLKIRQTWIWVAASQSWVSIAERDLFHAAGKTRQLTFGVKGTPYLTAVRDRTRRRSDFIVYTA